MATPANFLSRSTLLHLRIPFSLYLMPVFCFAASQPPMGNAFALFVVFVALHFFLYPASNGYNSYFDKDEGSIGGLEKPPAVEKGLYYTALLFDGVALLLGFLVSWQFVLMMFIYGLISKAYSHPAIRLKKYGVIALLAAAIFQGGFTYIMAYQALHGLGFAELLQQQILLPALISTFMILGFYPMTQVYQHAEDRNRGDMTISIMLGIRGTFVFTALVFALSAILFYWYFISYFSLLYFCLFLLSLVPLLIYFINWFFRILRDESQANFRSTMFMNKISSLSLIAFFMLLALLNFI